MNSVVIRAPSRLHFGLLGWGPSALRQFGGLGLMVEDPGLEVEIRCSTAWNAKGPLAARSLTTARSISQKISRDFDPVGPFAIDVRQAPPEHVGLGVGTQLTLSVARAILDLSGETPPNAQRLASLTGRGQRSGIGLHGFLHGGLLLDGGRSPVSEYPPLLGRYEFPENWRVLVVLPELEMSVHGSVERKAFEAIPGIPVEVSDRLASLVLLGVLPALIEKDLPAFGEALQDLQRRVGKCFAPAQGGDFAHPSIERVARSLEDLGLRGVGQSSWGPTVYGFTDVDAQQRAAILESVKTRWSQQRLTAFWTRASRSGADSNSRRLAADSNAD